MTRRLIAAATLVLFVACGAPRDQGGRAQSTPLPTGTLDQLLAPVALYPDSLLAQMLMSAADPAKVTELDKWLKDNKTLKGTALQDAAVKAGFDASFVALTLFPDVVARMADQIAWTRVLGQAFMSDRSAVFATIQKLRLKAKNVGTLKSSPQQSVETKKTSAGQDVIVIEPTNPQIVYVPQYNTDVVYTQAPSSTVVVVQEDNDADVAVAAGLIGFTAGIAIGAAMNNNYYYGPYGFYGGAYMYNDAWDDYYDHREDAREDWMDHREDIAEDRGDRRENIAEERGDRAQNSQEQRTQRQENRPDSQAQRQERRTEAQAQGQQRGTNTQAASQRTGSPESRGYTERQNPQAGQQSTRSSDAFSGYSSGRSERAATQRGSASRGSSSRSRGGGGGGRRR